MVVGESVWYIASRNTSPVHANVRQVEANGETLILGINGEARRVWSSQVFRTEVEAKHYGEV